MRHIILNILAEVTPGPADVDTASGSSRGLRRVRMARARRSRTALRSAGSGRHLLVPACRPRTAGPGGSPPRRQQAGRPAVTAIAATVQAFFTERLAAQRRASPHTIAAYRDTLRMLLGFAAGRTGTLPCRLDVADLAAPMIAAFLDHLEHQRGNSIPTRNARLAAIHSLFAYAALRHPEHAADIDRVLAIPPKRASQTIVTYLTDEEAEALLAAPDRATRTGRRDHAWIQLAIQTGLRASELTGLTIGDVHLSPGAYVACHGKGRKDRITPLTPGTTATLRTWLAERAGTPRDPLFSPIRGGPMRRDPL